jgi:Ca2+-binding EF-hand superfamily protein
VAMEGSQDPLRDMWALLTKAGNKRVQTQHLGAVLKKLGHDVPPEKLTQMLKKTPTDGTGSVDYKGFLAFFALLDPQGDVMQACKARDTDKDGWVSEDDMKHVLVQVRNMSAQQAAELVASARDGSGLIEYEEFVKEVLK